MDRYDVKEETWKENEWSPDLENDVLSTAFSCSRHTQEMEEVTG